ncbi:hypothetical protein ACFX1R_020424 [Malus domestica]
MAGGSPKADLEELGTRFGTNLILSKKEQGGVCIERKDVESALLGFQYTLIAEVLTAKLGHPTRICKETLDERTGPEDCPKTRNEAFAFRGLDAVLDLRGNPLGSGSKSRASSGSNGRRSGSERSQSGSECTAPLEDEVIDIATSPSKPRWSSNKIRHRDKELVGKIKRQWLIEKEARSARELAFDASLIGPGGVMAAGAEHVVLNDNYEQEGRVDTVSVTFNGGSTFDLNLMPVVGEDGDSVSVSRRKASDGQGCVSGNDLATDDDPFELEAIIEAVMNENKGKKRIFREYEYDEVNPCVEPKRSKLSRKSFVEADETSLDNLLEQNRLHTPNIMVLLETKNKSNHYGYLKKRLDLEYMHAMEPRSIGGCLCVFLRDTSQVTLVKFKDFVIEVKIWDEHKKCHWYLFVIYASTDEKKRQDQWGYLSRRLGNNKGKTFLIGDFNDILCNDEKEGGNYRPTSSMRDFREFVAQNELMDLGFVGYPFTWRNNQEAKPIQQRLDRGLATIGWQDLYPENTIRHVVLERSDHALLFFAMEKVKVGRGRKFSYDVRWSNMEKCRQLVVEE